MNSVGKVIKHIVIIAILIWGCLLLQNSVFSRLRFGGIMPNLLIIVTSSFGFMRGRKSGTVIGFVCGLLLDCLTGGYIGMYALIYMLIGFLNGFFRSIFSGDDIRMPLIMIAASDGVYGVLIYLFLFLLRGRSSFGFYLMHIIIPEVLYTVVISLVFYPLLLKICRSFDEDDRRDELQFG